MFDMSSLPNDVAYVGERATVARAGFANVCDRGAGGRHRPRRLPALATRLLRERFEAAAILSDEVIRAPMVEASRGARSIVI
jgi:hypothetical protein